MTTSPMFRRWSIAAAMGTILALSSASSLGSAEPRGPAKAADIDPTDITYKLPSQITWRGKEGVSQTAVILGDPSKPGLYIELVKWFPHNMSRPHFHLNDQYITVLSGTWWVGSGTKYDPDSTVPMPPGSFVTDLAGRPHYDGAKDETAVIEIVGQGPATSTSAEAK